jgi:hypothetical protein
MGNHAFERIVLSQPFESGLGSHLRYAGDIIRRVSYQGQVIDYALRRNAELRDNAFPVELFIAHSIDQGNVVAHQLSHILVAGRNHRIDSLGSSRGRQRADYIVGLDPLDHQDRPTQDAYGFMDRLDLLDQILGHCGSRCLVVWINIISKGFPFCIKHACKVC